MQAARHRQIFLWHASETGAGIRRSVHGRVGQGAGAGRWGRALGADGQPPHRHLGTLHMLRRPRSRRDHGPRAGGRPYLCVMQKDPSQSGRGIRGSVHGRVWAGRWARTRGRGAGVTRPASVGCSIESSWPVGSCRHPQESSQSPCLGAPPFCGDAQIEAAASSSSIALTNTPAVPTWKVTSADSVVRSGSARGRSCCEHAAGARQRRGES